jgi:predicted TIM-barrel fold metal-dependent hydrolase
VNREPHPEAVVEPDLRIVDPHHHLWDYRPERTVAPQYLLEELRNDTGSGHFIDKTVFVECGHAYRTDAPEGFAEVGETEAIAAECERSRSGPGARIAGIVGSCDLRLVDRLGAILDAHEAAGRGLFRGIRHRLAFDPTGSARSSKVEPNTEGLMKADDFRAGVTMLGNRGYTFDAWLYHVQLPELIDLAVAVPGTTIVLDHIGAPLGVGSYANRRAEIHAWWSDQITALAACPNVVVKLGGVGMSPYGSGWAERGSVATSDEIIAAWGEPIRHIIERFGANRCMFESNFPVDKVSFSYRTMWNAYKRMTSDLPSADRAQLFAGTAERVYRV